ncbi:MAG TPA: hypothetical protein VFS20_32030 [Longimicrobium sp.]|nr:hypothetical protein [Longimicrobium sp.]
MQYTLVERARTDSAAELTEARSIAVDQRGNIYVADRSAIRLFGPEGRLLRTIGRLGSGPGEFDWVATVGLLPGDSLYAFDMGNGRLTVFASGTFRVAYTSQIGREQLFPAEDARLVQGGRLAVAMFQAAYGSYDDRETRGPRKTVVRLLNADGSLRKDSVLAVGERENLILHNPEAIATNPFGRTTHFAFATGDRIVSAWSDSLKFDVHTIEGRHLTTVRPSYAPPRRQITGHDRDSVSAALANDWVPTTAIRRALDRYEPTTWPLLQAMLVDDQDRIWTAITGARGEPVHWIAFDMEGERVAQVDLPENTRLRVVRGSRAYAVVVDDDDVPQVVVYDLTPSQPLALGRR